LPDSQLPQKAIIIVSLSQVNQPYDITNKMLESENMSIFIIIDTEELLVLIVDTSSKGQPAVKDMGQLHHFC